MWYIDVRGMRAVSEPGVCYCDVRRRSWSRRKKKGVELGTRTRTCSYRHSYARRLLSYVWFVFVVRSGISHVTFSPSGVWVPGPIRSLLFRLDCLCLIALSYSDRHHLILRASTERASCMRFVPLPCGAWVPGPMRSLAMCTFKQKALSKTKQTRNTYGKKNQKYQGCVV